MSNIFVLWRGARDPPSPWTRLTRQGKYIRLTDSAAYHLVATGALTHDHDDTMSAFSIGNCSESTPANNGMWGALTIHNHPNPSSYNISAANNDPAYYCLDLIYMDFAVWKTYHRSFPEGAVVLSSAALAESANLARFADADGKLIKNDVPGVAGGSTGTRTHTVTATPGSGGLFSTANDGSAFAYDNPHTHGISLTSSGSTNEPRTMTTRLYEILSTRLAAHENMVAFCDGTPDGDWEILSSWKDANLKSGDSNPTLGGSDTHNETVSGNTQAASIGDWRVGGGVNYSGVNGTHIHPVTGTLKTVSHVPASVQIMPIRLTKSYSLGKPRAQLIGLW